MTNGTPVTLLRVKRPTITNGDFSAMDMGERTNTLKGQFYMDESDVQALIAKRCLVIDDSVMYGTHCLETMAMLGRYGVDKSHITSFSFLSATPELLLQNPLLEHQLNEAFAPTVGILQEIFGQAQLPITLRLVKLLLKMPEEPRGVLVEWLRTARPDALNMLFKAAKAEELKGSELFAPGCRSHQTEVPSQKPKPEQGTKVVLVRHGQSTANAAKEANPYEYLYQKFVDRSLVDAALTSQGEAEARQAGLELFGESGSSASDIGLVVVSPLRRALQTATQALQAATGGLPEQCRLVAHPLAAEHFFDPDIAENQPAAVSLLGEIGEVAGRVVDFSLCHEWAKKSTCDVEPKDPQRVTETDAVQNARELRDFLLSATPAGTTAVVFSHFGVIKALTGKEVVPGTALKIDDISSCA